MLPSVETSMSFRAGPARPHETDAKRWIRLELEQILGHWDEQGFRAPASPIVQATVT